MDSYLSNALSHQICGIEAQYWIRFFKAFQDQQAEEEIHRALEAIAKEIKKAKTPDESEQLERIRVILTQINGLLS